ncbi:hypothetical protein HKX48_005626 [Thoreauomyces humboldtii]|nr:hypothetical protein HKX48_005626 [Thoreauomyces humboldtii]
MSSINNELPVPNTEVIRNGTDGDFKSKLVVTRSFQAGEVIASIEGFQEAEKRWSSVQVSADTHIELGSQLVYMNHSCNPAATIDTERMQVVAARDLKAGDEMTFFYPSTEWEMSQPFDCWCGASQCIKRVSGAKDVPAGTMTGQYLSPHIRELLKTHASS